MKRCKCGHGIGVHVKFAFPEAMTKIGCQKCDCELYRPKDTKR